MNFVLPTGWVTAPIADVVLDVKTTDPSTNPDTEITYFDISSIDNEAGKVADPKIVLGADAPLRARQIVESGDVLFSTVRPNLRAIAQVPDVENGIASTGFCVLRSAPIVVPKYLYFFVRSEGFLDALLPLQRGVSYPAVRSGDIISQEISLAPTSEQTRIVEKLEELLSDLDAGVAELKAAQKKLAQYRQSLLKAAVEGALTAEWRKHNPPQETGAQLLERILKERRARWEAKQLAKFAEKGKTLPKDWRAKYSEPVKPDTGNFPELPEGWEWASLDQLVAECSYGTSVKCNYESTGTAILRIPNVVSRRLDLTDLKYATRPLHLDDSEYLSNGDILVVRTNGSISLVGRAAEVVGKLPSNFYYASYLLRFRCVQTKIIPSWISAFLASSIGRRWIEGRAASSAGQHNISMSTLLSIPIPLPPLSEQAICLEALVVQFENVEQQEQFAEFALKQSAAQRKNILKAAFSGQLVPQDPNEEPASVLLERIRAERAARGAQPKTRKTRVTKEAA